MNVELKIDPKDIEFQVTNAIVTSSFGSQLKEAVESALKNLGSSYSYENQLKKWVESKMRDIVMAHVETNHAKEIEEKIKTWLTTEKLSTITSQVMSEIVRKLTPNPY